MTTRAEGRRLAVVLPPRWPRWGSLVLSTFVTAAWLGILIYFVAFTDEPPSAG